MLLPPPGDDWVAVTSLPLPLGELACWPAVPSCGAVVSFAGTVRDHSEGRPGVSSLEYEAYVEGAQRAMTDIAADMRRRWPGIGRLALLHRTGAMTPADVVVVVAVSTPHRTEAFDAASFGIATIKATVPIWKRETWDGGVAWGLDAHYVGLPPDRQVEDGHDATAEGSGPARKLRSVGA